MSYFVTADGGLTTAGYIGCVVLMLAFLAAAAFLSGHQKKSAPMSARKLAFCAMAMALAFVTSYIKFLKLPYGGSVTLFSMLFIVLVAYWYGPKTGILVGFSYGLLQFIQEPYVLSLFQVCCDYVLAFAALGIAGFFAKKKHGLLIGYVVAVLARGFFHTLGGYLYWMDYMPENFPQSLSMLYPIIYNYSYLLAEGVLTVILISLPPVAKALDQVKSITVSSK
ncbi:MAG: energy-coupled thiamine transporter ThiT [Fusicatenibacter sp.]